MLVMKIVSMLKFDIEAILNEVFFYYSQLWQINADRILGHLGFERCSPVISA